MLHLDTVKEMPRYFIFWSETLWLIAHFLPRIGPAMP